MIYINPHSLTNVSFSTKIEKKNFSEFFYLGLVRMEWLDLPPQNVFSYYSPTFNGDDHCRLTDWRQGEYRAICLWKMDFCNISLGLKRKESNYWGVRRGGSAEHCVSISVAVCIERALLQPKWWHPLLQSEPQPNCAARVVGATSGGSHCCSKSGGSQCFKSPRHNVSNHYLPSHRCMC